MRAEKAQAPNVQVEWLRRTRCGSAHNRISRGGAIVERPVYNG
jgi:hypothetical protein